MNIPFLSEARAVLDWTCTATTLTLYEWLKLDGISKDLFARELTLLEEQEGGRVSGVKQGRLSKCIGVMIFILVIFTILFPLLLMSVAQENSQPNPWRTGGVSITLETFEPFFIMDNIPTSIDNSKFDALDKEGLLISGLKRDDVTLLKVANQSKNIWTISPGSRQTMTSSLMQAANGTRTPLNLYVNWKFSRTVGSNLASSVAENTFDSRVYPLDKVVASLLHQALVNMTATDKRSGTMILLPRLFPKYVHLGLGANTNDGKGALPQAARLDFVNCSLHYLRDVEGREWWELYAHDTGTAMLSDLAIMTYSDQVIPPTLSFLMNYGVVG